MKLDKMTKQKIDEFFDSKTPEELEYLWKKYDKYSEENLTIPVVVRKSEQLKENKKPTFKEWLESEGYVDCERHYLKNGIQYEVRNVLLNYEEKIRTL